MSLLSLPNLLLIVGTDRNAGKTTLATQIISFHAPRIPITAVKISPHFHDLGPEEEIISKQDSYIIVRENSDRTGKDSSRFLLAGAKEVYYMQVWDRNLEPAFLELLKFTGRGSPMIIESGWLRNIVVPGLFIIVNRAGNTEFKHSVAEYRKMEHLWVESSGDAFTPGPGSIAWDKERWTSL